MFEISAVQVAAVYAIVEVIRGLLPAQWLSIDGKIRVWILVTVASVAVVFQGDPPVVDTQDFLDIGVDVISLAIAAIVANGAVASSGLKTVVRKVATLGGTTNNG